MAIYKTRSKQTVYDLAIQLYGDLSKIGEVMKTFTDLDNVIPVASEIDVPVQTDPQALYFTNNKIIVATDI
jgi:hypothetical protein